jgi:hypothetical protein
MAFQFVQTPEQLCAYCKQFYALPETDCCYQCRGKSMMKSA